MAKYPVPEIGDKVYVVSSRCVDSEYLEISKVGRRYFYIRSIGETKC